VLACTDETVLPVSQVFDAIRKLGNQGVEQLDPLIITSASSLSNSISLFIILYMYMLLVCYMQGFKPRSRSH
jgi:hypothetical protein